MSEDDKVLYKRKCLNGFLSTPKFIAALTDISEALIPQTNRKAYLKEQLLSLNQRLPSSVYIPFVNESTRNYAILHIVTDEAKVFQTKERAPLLLCMEAFRPEAELTLISDMKTARKKTTKNKKNTLLSNKPREGGDGNNYLPHSEDPLEGG